jgi:hypothetical protein
MYKTIGILIIIVAVSACKPQTDYKEARDEVIKLHDVVMADQGKVVSREIQISGMLKDLKEIKVRNPRIDTLAEKDSLLAIHSRLTKADEAMNDWMHKFEPDVTGKSNEEAVEYFQAEKLKIQRVDTMFKQEIQSADAYLSKFKG